MAQLCRGHSRGGSSQSRGSFMSRCVLLFVIFSSLVLLMASGNVDADRSVPSLPQPPMPAMEPGWDFKSPAAREAKRKYDAVLKEAETKFARAISDAQKALIEDLEAMIKESIRAADLDEALKLRAAIESVQREGADRSQPTPCPPPRPPRVQFPTRPLKPCSIPTAP